MKANPAISRLGNYERTDAAAASYKGVTLKTAYFALITFLSALLAYGLFNTYNGANFLMICTIAAPVVAIICAVICTFNIRAIPVAGTIYTVAEGLLVGCVSVYIDAFLPGAAFAALITTCVAFIVMTVLYSFKIVRVGNMFKRFMICGLTTIVFAQFFIFLISLIFPAVWGFFYGGNIVSLILSVGVALFATLMLLFDFSNITEIVERGMDKSYEWYGAFGLTLTLIWMYVQILRIIAMFASRKN